MQEFSLNGLTATNNELSNQINTVRQAINREVRQRERRLTNSLPDVSFTTNALQREASSFRTDVDAVMAGMEEMFAQNEFYVKDARNAYVMTSEIIG